VVDPGAFTEAGLAYLVERQLGRTANPCRKDPLDLAAASGISRDLPSWLAGLLTTGSRRYDARRGEIRRVVGRMGGDMRKTAEVNIPARWWYNQHWGPIHRLSTQSRGAQALFMSLAYRERGPVRDAVRTSIRITKIQRTDFALDEMGGIWSESNGHGGYGPLLVIPISYQAAETGLGIKAFERSAPQGFAREYIRAAVYTMMPHNSKMAYIDDSSSGYPVQQARVAPLFARHYKTASPAGLATPR
jgi:hypothetical protein